MKIQEAEFLTIRVDLQDTFSLPSKTNLCNLYVVKASSVQLLNVFSGALPLTVT